MRATLLSIIGLLLMITLIVMFFSKKPYPSYETKIYRSFLFAATAFICVGLITYIVAVATNDFGKIAICQKIYMSLLVVLNYLSVKYCLSLFFQNKENQTINSLLIVATMIFIILVVLMPLNPIFYDDVLDGSGLSYDVAMLDTIISFIFFIVISVYLLIKRINMKKIVPFLILIALYVLTFIFRNYYKELTFEGFFYAYILLVMYHTIENPDLKMLEEYNTNKELAELNMEDKSNLLFQVSQEVSAPIRKIKILSNSALNSSNIEEIKENIRSINNLTNGISNTVDDILDITSMDKNNIKTYESSYNIYNLFSQVVYMIKNKIDSSIDFKYSINSSIPNELYGDSIKLKQIISAILLNSSKHALDGIIDLDISAIAKNDICRLIITMSDSGKGMSLQKINKVLSSEEKASTDIFVEEDYNVDLKSVKKNINMLGGNLLIKSYDGEGTVFTIVLDQLIANYKGSEQNAELESYSNKKRVLIVDDDYQELELLSMEFKKNNYYVVSTMYGKDCLDKIANKETFDYIFLDDEMEGYNAVKIIDELPKDTLQDTKVFVMLEKDKESIKEHYLNDYPFTDYLLKANYKEEIKRVKEKHLK